jgi:outer membrane protein OmpA-like peptidoglycan-associated protein
LSLWNSEEKEHIEIRIVSQNPDWDGNDFGLDRIKFYECQEVKLKIVEDKPVVLRNVLFDTNSAVIVASSFSELNELVGYLKSNKDKKIVFQVIPILLVAIRQIKSCQRLERNR